METSVISQQQHNQMYLCSRWHYDTQNGHASNDARDDHSLAYVLGTREGMLDVFVRELNVESVLYESSILVLFGLISIGLAYSYIIFDEKLKMIL